MKTKLTQLLKDVKDIVMDEHTNALRERIKMLEKRVEELENEKKSINGEINNTVEKLFDLNAHQNRLIGRLSNTVNN